MDPLATILMATIDESENECCWQRQGSWPFFFVLKKNKMGQMNIYVVTCIGDGKCFEDEVIENMTTI